MPNIRRIRLLSDSFLEREKTITILENEQYDGRVFIFIKRKKHKNIVITLFLKLIFLLYDYM